MGSACCVYAIVSRDTSLPTETSDDAVALSMVPCRALAAVTGPARDDAGLPTMQAVLQHESIVEAVRRLGPALPVRFGTVFRDASSVASALAERYDALSADLDRLGDKVELGVTAMWATDSSADGGDGSPAAAPHDDRRATRSAGARYLRDRAAQARHDDARRERARAVAAELDRALGPLALERRMSLVPTPRIALRATYLLEPSGVHAFTLAFEATRRTRSEVRALLTGPWPPYSFVRRREADGAGAPSQPLVTLLQRMTDVMR